MTTMLPDQQPGASEELAEVPPRSAKWYLGVAMVLALVLGGLAGYFVGRATAPDKTVTKTVTRTVRISAPPYATSSTVNATVVFDGTVAAYSGPAEVKAGTVVNFALKSTEPDVLLAVGRVDPGITWEIAAAYTSTYQPNWISDLTTSNVNVTGVTTATLNRGVYLVVVLTSPTSTDRAYHATMIRVTR
jgi:hypothetical protein